MQDLKANEARLQELNSIADRLTAMGQTEAAEKIREQITVSVRPFVILSWLHIPRKSVGVLLSGHSSFSQNLAVLLY